MAWRRATWVKLAALVAVVALLAVGAGWLLLAGDRMRHVTAYFTAAVGVYPGSDVRVLGVAVGTIDDVHPDGQQVRVSMSLDKAVPIPADATALVVTPSLVSDRYVQLAPVYTGGAQLGDDATIPVARTAVPVELDQLYASLDKLTTALGPNGANANGALSDLLRTGAATMGGNGQSLGEAIRSLGDATRTLAGSQDDLVSTLDNLQKFTSMLATNDQYVTTFDGQLSQFTQLLADERDTFGAALSELAGALSQVQQFINDHRAVLKSDVDKLASITQVLVNQRASLAEAVDTAPLALQNLVNAYDPATGTIDSRANLTEFSANPTAGLPLPVAGG
jgi:virulence factor Mce-like protein